jgi:hypothetical protein
VDASGMGGELVGLEGGRERGSSANLVSLHQNLEW